MIVYRLCRAKWADDLSGEGSRLFGGRWNHKMTPCIYTSESRALAILEYTVNIQLDEIPRALKMISIEIPDQKFNSISVNQLPGNWRDFPSPFSTKDFGTALLKSNQYPVIQIPSTIIPEEKNYILNPINPLFKIVAVKDFIYDIRIKQ